MRARAALAVIALALVAPGVTAGTAQAKSYGPAQVLHDCLWNNALTHHYTLKVLQKALHEMSSDTAQYADCSTLIQQAEVAALAGAHKHTTSPARRSSGSSAPVKTHGSSPPPSAPPTPSKAASSRSAPPVSPAAPATEPPLTVAQQGAIGAAFNNGGAVQVGKKLITPGLARVSVADAASTLPTPLLALLSLLLAAAALAGGRLVHRRVLARRQL